MGKNPPAEDGFDPLSYSNLADQIVDNLEKCKPAKFTALKLFPGAGVYAIYLDSEMEPYAGLADRSKPVYVGKAVPQGQRKGTPASGAKGNPLYQRLKDHSKSLLDAQIQSQFSFRWLPVKDVWIPFAERSLIEKYKPVWNLCIEGFGVKVVGKNRVEGVMPWWDVLHPGREGRGKPTADRTREAALELLRGFYAAGEDAKAEMARQALDPSVGDE